MKNGYERYQGKNVFSFMVIDMEDEGVVDRFETFAEAREAYPDYEQFKVTRWSDAELAERDAVFAPLTD